MKLRKCQSSHLSISNPLKKIAYLQRKKKHFIKVKNHELKELREVESEVFLNKIIEFMFAGINMFWGPTQTHFSPIPR